MDRDRSRAFCDYGVVDVAGAPDGPLSGTRFAVKDLFDVAGLPTGAGNPDWLRTHEPPRRNAPVVQTLLDAGASLVGKTHTDELAWSLNGENVHYGTPVNPGAPERIPGGSSSGSASAVAAGLVDFAIGTDTGGSVRLPASYCGIFGIRPTHGLVPLDGAVPLAPSLDTVGWFARDAGTLRRVGGILLPPRDPTPLRRLVIAKDAFAEAGGAVASALADAAARIASLFGNSDRQVLAPEGLGAWRDVFRVVQASEAWASHGEWIRRTRPAFGPGVADRFEAASRLDPAEAEAAASRRTGIRARMDGLLDADGVIVLPCAPGIAPLRGTEEAVLDEFRARALAILCPAGLAGLPQVAIPAATLEGCPLGISLIGPRGSDAALLDLALRVEQALA
jgi:amidase